MDPQENQEGSAPEASSAEHAAPGEPVVEVKSDAMERALELRASRRSRAEAARTEAREAMAAAAPKPPAPDAKSARK